MNWKSLPSKETIESAIAALNTQGFVAEVVSTKDEAKEKVLSYIPNGAEVMTMISETVTNSGIEEAIKQSKKHVYLKDRLYTMEDGNEKRQMGAAPEYAIGSVHAVTEKGTVLIASNSGSQLPAYSYGAKKVIWVVGTQKIVPDTDAGLKRIYEYVLPLESERAKKAYGVSGSNVSKVLILNKEIQSDRIKLIFINESIGF